LNHSWNITTRQAELLTWVAAKANQTFSPNPDHETIVREFHAWKARGLFGMLFGTIAKGHRKCSRRQCRRARRCNYAHLDCAKAFAPPSENEQIEAIASFNRFVHMAQTPTAEEAECGESSSFSGG
jgi:hypothetical protein